MDKLSPCWREIRLRQEWVAEGIREILKRDSELRVQGLLRMETGKIEHQGPFLPSHGRGPNELPLGEVCWPLADSAR